MIPTTGLSLIIHLLIIIVAKVIHFFASIFLGNYRTILPIMNHKPEHYNLWSRSLAVFILGFLFAASTYSLTVAIKTSIAVGKTEPQIEFVKTIFSSLQQTATRFVLAPLNIWSAHDPEPGLPEVNSSTPSTQTQLSLN